MAAKSGENWNFLILYRILFYYPVSQKFCPNRSISYGFWDIRNEVLHNEVPKWLLLMYWQSYQSQMQ